ncbi:zinc finger protein 830 [Latimeria chalumnae]|uniref:zinc finger protein 830 n=1 Tax=Latimeria chalumnae TaxID=7897 RepID=UPI00313B1186
MAASVEKGKKVVKQEELRRLMREKQRQVADSKKIESPFAKYNSLGHLSCVLCNIHIKSELLWPAHILGKQHKEKVVELKGAKQTTPSPSIGNTSAVPAGKRKGADTESTTLKKVRVSGDHVQLSKFSGKAAPHQHPGLNLLQGEYSDEDDEEDDDSAKPVVTLGVEKPADIPPPAATAISSDLPADFFDSSIPPAPVVSHSGSIQKPAGPEKPVEKKENTAEALPEGFFDDPVVDAKVRKVDAPKDQMDKEWEEFQKEMRQVNTVSEAIVAEEDEEGRLDRQIGEIDEQIECYRRIEHLRDRQEVVKSNLKDMLKSKHTGEEEEADIGSEDEEELQDLLSGDWRAKRALL